jgi:Plasmid rolling circle replication initiator protein and truncated derivatives
MSSILSNFMKISESENLLSKKIASNNDRLDIYKDRMNLKDKYLDILKHYVVKDEFVKKQRQKQKEENSNKIIISETAFYAIQNCSTWFRYETDKSWSKHKLNRSNRCKHKYCPQCARVQALKRTLEAQYLMTKLFENNYDFLFLTLTLRNCNADEIKQTMDNMNKAVNQRFLKYKEIKEAFHGNIRKFELTYNPYLYRKNKLVLKNGKKVVDENKKPFNPHIHMIIAVKKSYFGKRYIKQHRLRELWQRALDVDYLPMVNIKKVKLRTIDDLTELEQEHAEYTNEEFEKQRLIDGAFEIGKYMAKSTDYLISDRMFHIFYENLFKRRNWTVSGIFRQLKKEAKENEVEILKEMLDKEIDFIHIVEYNYNNNDSNYYMTRLSRKDKEKEENFNVISNE